jgi:hypothetical protein
MAPPTSALRDYGLAIQARETDGDGAPSLPFGKGRVARSTFYRKLWRFRRLEATTLTNECCQFSVRLVFSRASAGVRSRLAGIGVQKSEMEASSLAEVFFFESHIRSTNAPARRSSIMSILLIMSKTTMLTRCCASLRLTRSLPLSSPCGLPSAVFDLHRPRCRALRAAFRQSIFSSPELAILDLSQRSRFC